MHTLVVVSSFFLAWGLMYVGLSQIMFRSRSKKWEYMEDMVNCGCQTSLLLVLAGVLATVGTFLVITQFTWFKNY